jgi:phenylacetate-CoA ligase
MTATAITELDLLRARMAGAIGGQMPGHIGRLGWNAGQLAVFQRDRLRELLARAIECSPFHAARLRGIDPGRFDLADLARLPVMTKTQMMDDFDAVVTDRRLRRDLVERHLAGSAAEPSLLLGEHVCLVSGGSSGLRGVFVQAVGEYAEFVCTIMRRPMAAAVQAWPPAAAGTSAGPPPEGLVIGIVGAGSPVHSSGMGAATATAPPLRLIPAPAGLPTAEIVRRLNAAQPPALMAYAAKLAELAREQREGRLRLALTSVTSMSEAISPAEREAIGDAFGVPVTDLFVSTEGLVGRSEPGRPVLTFASDTCIAECVDDEGQPVPDGVASSKVLVTNLHNLTQPLIRYELADRFTPAGLSAGGFLRASVDGRSDDLFRYDHASVHPFVIGAALLRAPAVREFQVRQTERGADVAAVTDGDVDAAAVTAAVKESLRQAGLPDPQVILRRVNALDRDPLTGKARRFIPLGSRIPLPTRRRAPRSASAWSWPAPSSWTWSPPERAEHQRASLSLPPDGKRARRGAADPRAGDQMRMPVIRCG